jgi:hypothetical protein
MLAANPGGGTVVVSSGKNRGSRMKTQAISGFSPGAMGW